MHASVSNTGSRLRLGHEASARVAGTRTVSQSYKSTPQMPYLESPGNRTGRGYANLRNDGPASVRDVWSWNLEEEFAVIRESLVEYPFVAIASASPGVVARPIGAFRSTSSYQFTVVKTNVDLLKIIQFGLTLLNKNGRPRPGVSTWQFNFHFSLNDDMYSQEGVDLLQESGIQFERLEEEGVSVFEFAELLLTSGLVLNDGIKLVSFNSGYDFAYLLKLLTRSELPGDEEAFYAQLHVYFPCVYDVKFLMKSCRGLKGELPQVSREAGNLRPTDLVFATSCAVTGGRRLLSS